MRISETPGKASVYTEVENKITDTFLSGTSFSFEQAYWIVYAGSGLLFAGFFLVLGYLF